MPPCLAASYYSPQRVGSGTGLVRFLFPVILPSKNSSDPLLPFLLLPKPSLHSSLSMLHPCRAPFIPLSSHTLSLLRSIRAPSPPSLPASIHSSVPPSLMICHGDWQQLIGLIPPWGLVALWPIWIQLSHCPTADTVTPESRRGEGERRGREVVREGCMYLQE